MTEIAIAGIGNVLMGDDAAGPYAAEYLRSNYDFSAPIDILDLGTPGMDLAGYLAKYRTVILIDTVRADESPGSVVRYEKHELMKNFASMRLSPHDPSVAQSLCHAELTGAAPARVLLIGIVPHSARLGEAMTPPVRRGAVVAAETALVELKSLGIEATSKTAAGPLEVWWENEPVAE